MFIYESPRASLTTGAIKRVRGDGLEIQTLLFNDRDATTDNSGPPSLNWSPLENAAPGPMLEGDWTAQSGYQATQELIRSHRGRIFGRRGRQ
jgi:hypothetical protein